MQACIRAFSIAHRSLTLAHTSSSHAARMGLYPISCCCSAQPWLTGPSFAATAAAATAVQYATFTKFEYMTTPYVDPLKARLQAEQEKRKHNVAELPFKPGAPMKKSTTPGDYYGTSGKIPYMPVRLDAKHWAACKLSGQLGFSADSTFSRGSGLGCIGHCCFAAVLMWGGTAG